MEWPLTSNRVCKCTFTWCFLFFNILQNEIWDLLSNFAFGSERVKLVPFPLV